MASVHGFKAVNSPQAIADAFEPASTKMPWTWLAERIQGFVLYLWYYNTSVSNPPPFTPYTPEERHFLPSIKANIKNAAIGCMGDVLEHPNNAQLSDEAIDEFRKDVLGIIGHWIPDAAKKERAVEAQVQKFTQLLDSRLDQEKERKEPQADAEGSPSVSINSFQNMEEMSPKNEIESAIDAAETGWINPLKTRKMLDPIATIKYFDALHTDATPFQHTSLFLREPQTNEAQDVQLARITDELHSLKDRCTPAGEDQTNLVFIPVVLNKGWLPFSRDHIVLITVDRDRKRIDYFDSFGISINNRSETLVQADLLTIKDLVSEVANVFFENQQFELRENTEVHQKDYHSCSIYVSDRARKIVDAGGLSDEPLAPLSPEDANQGARIEIIQTIFDWIQEAPFTERESLMV